VPLTRRRFTAQALASLTAYGLLESLAARDLLAADGRATLAGWFAELREHTAELRGQRMRDLEFQSHMEALFRRVDLPALTGLIDFDAVDRRLRGRGSLVLGVDLRRVPGLPARPGFGQRLFACRKGRAIVPHGHVDMCTGFIVLRGRWRGRHYERVETTDAHCILEPTIDRSFGPGDVSTISDHHDNVHWFEAETDTAYLFNVHVAGYDPSIAGPPGRLYLDPAGAPRPDGRILAARISSAACHAKYA
jgi:hypothetical protein